VSVDHEDTAPRYNVGPAYLARRSLGRARRAVRSRVSRPAPTVSTTSSLRLAASTRADRWVTHPAQQVNLPRLAGMSDADDRAMRIRDATVLPESFVLEAQRAVVAGQEGWVLVDDDLVEDLWSEVGFPTASMAAPRLAQREQMTLGGTSALLAMPWLPNYYHWTLQAAPRVSALGDAAASVDQWIISEGGGRHVDALLSALHIPRGKVVTARSGLHISCERLLAPSIPAPNRHIPGWVVDAVRGLFPLDDPAGEAIWLERPLSDKRRVVNAPALAQVVRRAGYRTVDATALSVPEQAALFSRAGRIAGILGAGLTNAVYAPAGARLIEVMPRNLVFPSYYKLARSVGLSYSFAIGSEKALPWPIRFPDTESDLVAPIDELEALLLST